MMGSIAMAESGNMMSDEHNKLLLACDDLDVRQVPFDVHMYMRNAVIM